MRVAFVPRSAEIKPLFWRFVLSFYDNSSSTTILGERGTFEMWDFVPLSAVPRSPSIAL